MKILLILLYLRLYHVGSVMPHSYDHIHYINCVLPLKVSFTQHLLQSVQDYESPGSSHSSTVTDMNYRKTPKNLDTWKKLL